MLQLGPFPSLKLHWAGKGKEKRKSNLSVEFLRQRASYKFMASLRFSSVAVTTHSDKSNLGENRFVLAQEFNPLQPGSGYQELEAVLASPQKAESDGCTALLSSLSLFTQSRAPA